MPVVTVIGAQWGDEGKGHIVDMLAERARLVVRYGGGNNAGHTVVNALGDFKLHVVPSGIFDPSIVNVIGTGVVIDPAKLIDEIDGLQKAGVNTDKPVSYTHLDVYKRQAFSWRLGIREYSHALDFGPRLSADSESPLAEPAHSAHLAPKTPVLWPG